MWTFIFRSTLRSGDFSEVACSSFLTDLNNVINNCLLISEMMGGGVAPPLLQRSVGLPHRAKLKVGGRSIFLLVTHKKSNKEHTHTRINPPADNYTGYPPSLGSEI